MSYQEESLDLEQLFSSVLTTMQQNRRALNEADEANHDHGDNMVDTFATITQAMRDTPGEAPSDRLAYAAEILGRRNSGSARMYADGLWQASREFEGKQVTRSNAAGLIQTLLGGGHATPIQEEGSRGLGDLLGSMLGGQQQQPQQSSGGLGDLLGSMLGGQQQQAPQSSGGLGDLLGSMLGGQQQQQPQQSDGLDMGDLLKAGMAYMSAKARGASNLQAIVSAVVAASAMGSGYREQSSSLVVNTLINAIQGMAGSR